MKRTFEEVIEANKDRLYRICKIYAVTPIEPQDLFQEVIFQVWKSFDSFKGNANISTWIYRIGLNVCMRSKVRLERNQNKTIRLESIQFTLAEDRPDEKDAERYDALRGCIKNLNEVDKTIVILFLEELPYKEIANITGVSENYVAVKMKRIRETLFNCITQKLG